MKSNSRSSLILVTLTTLMVTTLLSVANTQLDKRLSRLGRETIAPADLKFSHQILESSLRAENESFPVDQLAESSAYKAHLAKLAAYSERLEMHRRNDLMKSQSLSVAFLVALLAMIFAGFINNKKNKNEPNNTG